jgi:hypothetical protein
MNYLLFGLGIVFATLAALSIIPGLDILAWHLLQPDTFWQRLILIVVEVFTMWPRVALGMLVWTALTTVSTVMSE